MVTSRRVGESKLPVRAVVFSRDRAMQLDATLRSLEAHCAEAAGLRVDILYTASSLRLARQYEEVEQTWRGPLRLRLRCEREFRSDLLELLDDPDERAGGVTGRGSRRPDAVTQRLGGGHAAGADDPPRSPYVLFLVDDAIFCRPFSLTDAISALGARPRALGFSLRLGGNTTYCYALDAAQRVPSLEPLGHGVVAFDWTTAERDFAYPLEVSSSIYDAGRIARMLSGLDFLDPNTLEARLASTALKTWSRRAPELLCFARSVAFCAAVNRVQTVFANRAGTDARLSVGELSRSFDQGLRIATGAFAGFTPGACQCEVPLSFVPREDGAAGHGPRRPA